MILWRTIEDHDTLFVLAETAHFLGIGVLVYKLHTRKSVSGKCICGHRPESTLQGEWLTLLRPQACLSRAKSSPLYSLQSGCFAGMAAILHNSATPLSIMLLKHRMLSAATGWSMTSTPCWTC